MKKYCLLFIVIIFLSGCNGQKPATVKHKYTNALVNETSPYLLQHAHNPVNWESWNPKTLAKAKKENKLILISVGYAACHWCHVMEHESFEDEEVAAFMNENFINIKVDREERPDVDKVYMDALQLMTGSGGWPMNIIALPDGKPFWGGTYFEKNEWLNALKRIKKTRENNPEKIQEFADNLEKGLKSMMIVPPTTRTTPINEDELKTIVSNWSKSFDNAFGGNTRAPKFMMPSNLNFLLRYTNANTDEKLNTYINNTLTKIAYGGVYDHIGGGFSRYSVDKKWHIPHFEKMLYDNAQLVSTYSNAYKLTKNELYKNVVEQTLSFVERELMNKEHGFYSSLDADSNTKDGKLEEGAFYVWTVAELKELLADDFPIFKDYYNINNFGFWEHQNYVLIRKETGAAIAKKYKISTKQLKNTLAEAKTKLFTERDKRDRPRLDDKSLTSWNSLMLTGYIDAYKTFGDKHYLDIALKNANFILKKQYRKDGGLNHSYKNGKSTVNGYLEDYAATIAAFIDLYEVTLDTKWLHKAKELNDYAITNFFDNETNMFFFTSKDDAIIVRRSIEKVDNVIPSSNAIMAKNLYQLSHYLFEADYYKKAEQMLLNMHDDATNYGSSHTNWLDLSIDFNSQFYEIAVVGKNADKIVAELNALYIPNKIISGSTTASNLPILEGKYIENETYIYVCINNSCKLPVTSIEEALLQLTIK